MYLVTHAELSPGYQTAQTAHVIAEFCLNNPVGAREWDLTSGSLICLEAKNAEELYTLWGEAKTLGIKTHVFREPDIGDEVTAVLFEPGDATVKFLANLPCTGKSFTTERAATARKSEQRKRDRVRLMETTEQTKGQTILAHGISVREHYFQLLDHLKGNIDLAGNPKWRLPEWVDEYREELLNAVPADYVMDRYLTLHDCGKPDVLTVDDEGRRRFPGHAESSAEVFRNVFSDGSATGEQIADMILHDMDIHLLKAVGVPEFLENPNAVGHLLAGLAELTSNASMFGGIESDGFKMKFKALNQRGKAICNLLFGEGVKNV